MEMGLPPILIQQGKFAERRRRRMPNAERELKSPKKAKTNRSAIQANGSVPSTPVSLNIAQVSLKRPRLACFRLALNIIMAMVLLASVTLFCVRRSQNSANFNTVTITANVWVPSIQNSFLLA